MDVSSVLALAKSIERRQRRGSDYDALYFGLQDVIEMLEDLEDYQFRMSRATSSPRSAAYGSSRTKFDQERFDKMYSRRGSKPKRKLSKWQKFVKANSKKKQFIYQSGAKKGKLNLKKMGIAYRRQNKWQNLVLENK